MQNRATQTYERDFPSQKKASRGTCTLDLKSGSDFGQQTALLTTTIGTSVQLAGLHFNENSARAQAMTQTGKHMWGVSFPKARRGEPVIKAVRVTPTF
ncbi:hypothetical protein KUCAC02_033761, partial [Chaenocephalus aceratus]